MDDWILAVQQINRLRDYLDFELFRFNDPIWITEIGIHWAYSEWEIDPDGGTRIPTYIDPVDDYDWGVVFVRLGDFLGLLANCILLSSF